jgi:hypothetical protein
VVRGPTVQDRCRTALIVGVDNYDADVGTSQRRRPRGCIRKGDCTFQVPVHGGPGGSDVLVEEIQAAGMLPPSDR